MRYPIWMFMFVFVIPPFALHAWATGQAKFDTLERRVLVSEHIISETPRGAVTISIRSL